MDPILITQKNGKFYEYSLESGNAKSDKPLTNLQHFGSQLSRFVLEKYLTSEEKLMSFHVAVKNAIYRYNSDLAKEIGAEYILVTKPVSTNPQKVDKSSKSETLVEAIANFYVKK